MIAHLDWGVILLSAACSEPVRVAVAPPPPDPRPPFERLLDAHGVPFAPPRAGKAILVNIPAYEAIAFEDGHVVMRSRVIVGSVRNPTPVTDTYTTAVRFRPTWRPTPTMVASGEYEDKVWPAGRRNPLGLAAIRFEPGMLVYMHDTNRRGLFDREGRALSHGCVRTERWDDFAAWQHPGAHTAPGTATRETHSQHSDTTRRTPTPNKPDGPVRSQGDLRRTRARCERA
jgi:lipoprotein-anchoring transpeptidase ErfK/SrfK